MGGESDSDRSGSFPAAWLGRQAEIAHGLVLLSPTPLSDLERSVEDLADRMRSHVRETEREWERRSSREPRAAIRSRAKADHDRFVTSIEQLRWFLDIVRHDDHGGNRQALGQYWKVVLEALRRHIEEERAATS